MKLTNYLLTLILSLILAGCINYTQVTTLKIDGSGEMFIHYWMKVNLPKDSLMTNDFGIFNPDSIRKVFTSKYSNIKNIEVYPDYSDSTIHGKVEFSFSYIDSLNNTEPFKDANFSFKDGKEETKVFSHTAHAFLTGFGFENQNLSIKYIYYIPGKILSHNASLKENNKLTWQFNSEEPIGDKKIEVVFIPYKLKETPSFIYYISGIVFILVVYFLFRKKK